MNIQTPGVQSAIPFDTAKLDRLLDAAGIDVLIVTSKHNIQYLFGGYRFFFFEFMDAIGLSRYLPVFVYPKGHPEHAAFIGNKIETYEKELGKFWTPVVDTSHFTGVDAVSAAVRHINRVMKTPARIGVEAPFLPLDVADVLRDSFPAATLADATVPLERLRAKKSKEELDLLRDSSERVVASMQSTFGQIKPGMSKRDVVRIMRREEISRDLVFDYCLITAGTNLNRAPSDLKIEAGDIVSLDSGANYRGYIGDLCRMGILGQPDSQLKDLLAEVDAVQQAARKPIRAGARGGDIFAAANAALRNAPNVNEFLAHGMGLVSHEAPRLTSTGPVPYPAYDEDIPLESGMVISIETTIQHPKRGFVKLEDTVAVTDSGCEGFGDAGRGWNIIGG